MNLIIAALFVLFGLMATFRTDWVGKFKNDRDKRLCKGCGIGVLIAGISLLAFHFLSAGKN